MKQVRTYMSYTFPVDPVRLVTIPDMDLSYALGSTLVQWDADKQISGAVAHSWEVTSEYVYRFRVRSGLKWSDGTPVTSTEIKKSFERAFREYPNDLRSLINMVSEIVPVGNDSLEFRLKVPAKQSGLLGKLTEPNYSVLKIRVDGSIDLSISTGAFFLSKNTEQELMLQRNPNWLWSSEDLPEEIDIRKPPKGISMQMALLEDSWPNFIQTTSLIPVDVLSKYTSGGYSLWKRPIDKLYLLQVSKNFAYGEGLELVRYLYANLDRSVITAGLDGFSPTKQVFPSGYQLFDGNFPSKIESRELPKKFSKQALKILFSEGMNENLRKAFGRAISEALGVHPKFESMPLSDLSQRWAKGDYDLYVGTMGLADPDPEGIMSYYFEGDRPVVPSGSEPFVMKLDAARKEPNLERRLALMRALMSEATLKGHILPLFHLSTLGLGRGELDFGKVPMSDESVTLSKIRFKKNGKR